METRIHKVCHINFAIIAIQHLCKFLFAYHAYESDFQTTIGSFQKSILIKLFEELQIHNNKSFNETKVFVSDVELKMKTLTLTLDSIETLITWARFFPVKHKIFDPVMTMAMVE